MKQNQVQVHTQAAVAAAALLQFQNLLLSRSRSIVCSMYGDAVSERTCGSAALCNSKRAVVVKVTY